MKKITLFAALGILMGAASAWGEPITITFDSPPCPTFGSGTYLGDCYRDLGVTFSSGGAPQPPFGDQFFVIAADADAVSAPNVARPVPGFPGLNAEFFIGDPEGASGVSLSIVGTQPGQAKWRIVFATGSFIDTIDGFGNQRVSAPRCCTRGLTFFLGASSNAIDDLTFQSTAGAVPEPSTVLLIGTGVVALVRRCRRAMLDDAPAASGV